MRLSTILISSLATFSSATSSAVAPDNEQVAAAIQFAALADSCSLVKCAGVIANVACIAAAIIVTPETAGGSVLAALACVREGAQQICPCAACVPGLQDFLTENKVCES